MKQTAQRCLLILGITMIAVLALAACGKSDSSDAAPSKSDPAAYTQAFVQQAIDYYDANGRDATIAYYRSQESRDGEWYVFVHNVNTVTIAHFNADLLGRTRGQRIDVKGHDYGAELASMTEDDKWVDYVFLNPITGEETRKHAWAVRHDGLLSASGWYEPE